MRSNYLHPPKEIAAVINQMSVFPEIFSTCFDLDLLFSGSVIGIKLPYLSSDEVVGAEDVGIIIASIYNLELPHILANQTEGGSL